jgi:hypothetical protein
MSNPVIVGDRKVTINRRSGRTKTNSIFFTTETRRHGDTEKTKNAKKTKEDLNHEGHEEHEEESEVRTGKTLLSFAFLRALRG